MFSCKVNDMIKNQFCLLLEPVVPYNFKHLITLIPLLSVLTYAPVMAADKATMQHSQTPASSPGRIYGAVVETLEAGRYTYIQVNDGKKNIWVAVPTTKAIKGSMIAFDTQMEMKDFSSKSLGRKFDVIYFTSRIITDKKSDHPDGQMNPHAYKNPQAMADPHAKKNPHAQAKLPTVNQPVSGIEKAANGKTIAEIMAQKISLKNQMINVRGKVTKYSANVMGKNWIHIKDSSSGNALIITTSETAKINDVIVASGKIVLDKDLGFGYKYEIIMEDTKVVVEK